LLFQVFTHAHASMSKQLSRIGRLRCRIFGDVPRELSYRLAAQKIYYTLFISN